MKYTTLFGITAYILYITHAYFILQTLPYENLLWICHISVLIIGTGLIFKNPTLNAIGFLWLVIGIPMWIMEVMMTGEVMPTSISSHFGGLILSIYGITKLGFPKNTWWKGLIALFILQQITRWTTPETSNINIAFDIWHGWGDKFPSYFWYMVMLYAICGLVFLGVEKLITCHSREGGNPER